MPDRELIPYEDRCDSCGAQAFVLVFLGELELLFCGHHYAANESVLTEVCAEIYDHRDLINPKPSVSATV